MRRAAADIAAVIAKYALPRNEWPDLLGVLNQWSQVGSCRGQSSTWCKPGDAALGMGEGLSWLYPSGPRVCHGIAWDRGAALGEATVAEDLHLVATKRSWAAGGRGTQQQRYKCHRQEAHSWGHAAVAVGGIQRGSAGHTCQEEHLHLTLSL